VARAAAAVPAPPARAAASVPAAPVRASATPGGLADPRTSGPLPGGPGAAVPVSPATGDDRDSNRDDDRDGGGSAGSGRQLVARMRTFDGARSEVRRQIREKKRLRLVALALVLVAVVAAVPVYMGIRTATRDPVFTSLDSLAVPAWAAEQTVDGVSGSRWCLIDCRFRERNVESQRSPEETAQAYQQALAADGWRSWKPAGYCPEQPVEGSYTCWQRDELTLDLWVRAPACAADPLRGRPTVDPTADPSGAPPESSGEPPADQQLPGTDECDGSVVSVKVRNAIDDERLRPQPSIDPSFTGEDPDPIFTDDPLQELTPSPS
jgi:hypothetical protein